MTYKEKQAERKSDRKEFRDKVKIYCKKNMIYQKDIADKLGLTRQEFSNILNGALCSSKTKGIYSYDDFVSKVLFCISE